MPFETSWGAGVETVPMSPLEGVGARGKAGKRGNKVEVREAAGGWVPCLTVCLTG